MLDLARSPDTATDADLNAGARPESGRALRVLLTGYRSHPHVGGQGVYLFELSRALAELGHRVHVVSGPPYPELDPVVTLHKLPALDLFSEKNALLAFRPGFLGRRADLAEWALHNTGAFGEPLAFSIRLREWLASRRGAYDVVHDNQGLAAGMIGAARAGGAPLTATLHHPITIDLDYALAAAETPLQRALIRRWHGFVPAQGRTARKLAALLTVSEASKARAVADFGLDPDRITVAPNGIDHRVFSVRPDAPREPGLVVATASADVPIKGVDVLARAFCAAAAQDASLRLVLVGRLREGPARAHIEASGLGDRVTCVSNLAREEVAELYRRAALVVSPARFEGFGFPAAEAMACGACVLASDGGALPEVVGDAGVIVPAGDHEAMARAMIALLAAPAERARLGDRAAARARAAFSWRAHAEAAVALYARVGAC